VNVVVCVDPAGLGGAARAALSLALGLGSGVSVTAVAAASSSGRKGLLEACRRGARRGVEVIGPALDGVDSGALGKALAEVARGLPAELVLAGARSDREGRGIVGAAVAHHLGVPYLSHVEELALERPGEVVVTLRAGGWRRRLAVDLPAVLTVSAPFLPQAEDPMDEAGSRSPIELVRVDVPGTRNNPALLGTLDRQRRRKPEEAQSAGELVRRWRA
jgi:electron transfer flavoprotein beta subunit